MFVKNIINSPRTGFEPVTFRFLSNLRALTAERSAELNYRGLNFLLIYRAFRPINHITIYLNTFFIDI